MSPDDLLYTKEHEWLRIDGQTATVGITHHAEKELGEVVYVEIPSVGATFDAGAVFGTVESVKAVSELFLPVSGEVTAINAALSAAPEKINQDPYGEGWMIRIRMLKPNETAGLMSAAQYDEYTKEEK